MDLSSFVQRALRLMNPSQYVLGGQADSVGRFERSDRQSKQLANESYGRVLAGQPEDSRFKKQVETIARRIF